MATARLELSAERSESHWKTLCRHFAHKVEVTPIDEYSASVAFPMGGCVMWAQADRMRFDISAEHAKALDGVKHIIDTHVVRFKEINEADLVWADDQ